MEDLRELLERLDFRHLTKRQKIYIIVCIAGALLVLLGVLALLAAGFLRGSDRQEPEVTPTPEAATAAPARNTVTVAGKEVDPSTESFDLSGRTLTGAELEEIASLQALTTLSLTDCGLTDISFLGKLPGLHTLYLPGNKINDLTPLAGLKELRTLYLDRNPFTDLTPLGELSALTMLSLQGVSVTDYVLEDLQAAIPNCRIFCDNIVEEARPISLGGFAFTEDVETLDLSGREIGDISKLAWCLQLRELDLSHNPLRSLDTLSGLPKLTVLHLADTGLTDEHLAFLQTLTRLTYLDLRDNNSLTAQGLEDLEKALPGCQIYHDTVYYTVKLGDKTLTSDLGEVDLTGQGLTDIKGLEKFTMLRRLVLYGNSVGDIAPLRDLESLEELLAEFNNISDLTPLTGHTSLRRLGLGNNAVTDLTPLAGCTGLVELDIHNNAVTDLTPLHGCTALTRVDVTGNPGLPADQIRQLQAALPSCVIVTDADLSMPEPTPEPPAGMISPTQTPVPAVTAAPTATPVPAPTATPVPAPTATPLPTATPAPAVIPEFPEDKRIPIGGPNG